MLFSIKPPKMHDNIPPIKDAKNRHPSMELIFKISAINAKGDSSAVKGIS